MADTPAPSDLTPRTALPGASALDFVTARADRDAIRAGTYGGDLTSILHHALDQLEASGGGVLHLPPGLYPCNLVLGQEGRVNVHLWGEVRGATRLRSFDPGGFAVYDAFGYSNAGTLKRSIRRITFEGGGRGSGLLIANAQGTDTEGLVFTGCRIGMMVVSSHYGLHERLMWRECDVGAWFGTVGGRVAHPDVVLPPELAGYHGHAGNQTLLEPYFQGNRIGILVGQNLVKGVPLLRISGGSCESSAIGVFIPELEPGEAVAQERTAAKVLDIDGMWFEANGPWGSSSETVNGWRGRAGDVHLGSGVTELRNTRVSAVTITGGALYGDLLAYGAPAPGHFWDAPLGAALLDRGVGYADSYGPIVRRPAPWTGGGRAACAHVPPKLAFGRHPRGVLADRCEGPALAAGITRYGPADTFAFRPRGPLAEIGLAMTAPPGGLTGISLGYGDWREGKAYTLLVAAKPLDAPAWLEVLGNQNIIRGAVLCPADRWSFIAWVAVAGSNFSQSPILGVNNTSAVPVEVRFGGIALLEFDRKEEAAEVCAIELFPAL